MFQVVAVKSWLNAVDSPFIPCASPSSYPNNNNVPAGRGPAFLRLHKINIMGGNSGHSFRLSQKRFNCTSVVLADIHIRISSTRAGEPAKDFIDSFRSAIRVIGFMALPPHSTVADYQPRRWETGGRRRTRGNIGLSHWFIYRESQYILDRSGDDQVPANNKIVDHCVSHRGMTILHQHAINYQWRHSASRLTEFMSAKNRPTRVETMLEKSRFLPR